MCRGNTFLLPSYLEAFGVAYLEAMAAGLVAIGVEGQSPASFISNGQTGILLAPKSVDSIVKALMSITENPNPIGETAHVGRKHVTWNLTWDSHSAALGNVYRSVLLKGPIPHGSRATP